MWKWIEKFIKRIVKATYVVEWDNGETVLEFPCRVNLLSRKILSLGERKIVHSPYANEELDDKVENLSAEYIRFQDGTRCNVVSYFMEWFYTDQEKAASFYRGKNC